MYKCSGGMCNGWALPNTMFTFIPSFIQGISLAPLQVHYYSEALSTAARILSRSFNPKLHRQLRVKGLADGPYVTVRAGFEPANLRTKGDESTNERQHPKVP